MLYYTRLFFTQYITGKIPSGLPEFSLPPFSVIQANGTTVGFFEMVSSFGSGVLVLPIIGLIETISICKTFGR